MWVYILVGSFFGGPCTNELGSPVEVWRSLFEGDVNFPVINVTQIADVPNLPCAVGRQVVGGYTIEFNGLCSCVYRLAAVGHVLHAVANTAWSAHDPGDILYVPLSLNGTISRASVMALGSLGTPNVCRTNADCSKTRYCHPTVPGVCRDRPVDHFTVAFGLVCLLISMGWVVILAAKEWVTEGTVSAKPEMLLYADAVPTTEAVQIAIDTNVTESGI